MTKGVHYIGDKATARGHESEHANTRFLEHLQVNCALSNKHVQADTSKDRSDIHTSLCPRLSEAGGMKSTQMGYGIARNSKTAHLAPSKAAKP